MRKNNYYNFSALFCYEDDFQVTPVNSMADIDRILLPHPDDTYADCLVHVLQQTGV